MTGDPEEHCVQERKMHPYYAAIIEAYAQAGRPYFHQVTPVEARAMMRASVAAMPRPDDLPELAEVEDFTIDGPHGPIAMRRYRPLGESLGTCVFFHAGGWVIGDVDLSDNLCRRLAAGAGVELFSVDYRLAPEHPFPQPLDEAYAALEWAARTRPGPLLIAGESAGGNLAAACAIRARDAGGPQLCGQLLAYPVTNDDFESRSYREVGDRNWLLSTADMRWFFDHYCPAGTDRDDPLVAPLKLADASGLPPAMVLVAELDPLREEGLAYARKLHKDGVDVRTRCCNGMLHGFLSAAGAIPAAAEAVSFATNWMRARLEAAARSEVGA